ncbi:hypothetical protein FDP41_010965 [Naegleria fowleri]|uniref:Acid phosphatase n=1 Tax=Naegleria fowleri TaxID=5763 RepID=A0A6A5C0H5_NAEFO|nr:uncharacterized protein FDP41_010965 [Naegleria fowleri]KAF0982987.1 hypothetical protein FDP41_010965 [Naegleria fowleri]
MGELIQVQVVSRHCDRTTIHENEYIPNDRFDWYSQLGLAGGQLTGLGQQQCVKMGDVLYNRYLHPSSSNRIRGISSSYNQTQFHFRSTDYDRTLMSLFSVSMGLFKQGSGSLAIINNEEPNLGFSLPNGTQAIPIHTETKDMDALIRGFELCNTVQSRMKQVEEGPEQTKILNEYRTFIDQLYNVTGWHKRDSELHILFDLLLTQRSHQALNLEWVLNNWETLESLRDKLLRLKFSYATIGREGCSNFHKTLLEQIKSHKDKYIHYSAHDTTIQALAASLKLTQDYEFMGAHPPYGSNMVFELHLLENNKKAIRVVYNHGYNDSRFTPLKLSSFGCSQEFCDLDVFEKLLQEQSITTNWCIDCNSRDREVCCGKFNKGDNDIAIAFVSITPILVVSNLVTMLILLVVCLKNRRKYGYQGV